MKKVAYAYVFYISFYIQKKKKTQGKKEGRANNSSPSVVGDDRDVEQRAKGLEGTPEPSQPLAEPRDPFALLKGRPEGRGALERQGLEQHKQDDLPLRVREGR